MLSRCCKNGLTLCSINGYEFFMCEKCEHECDTINNLPSTECLHDAGCKAETQEFITKS